MLIVVEALQIARSREILSILLRIVNLVIFIHVFHLVSLLAKAKCHESRSWVPIQLNSKSLL